MRQLPLDVLLTWPKPNYINPEVRGPELWISTAIFMTAAYACVGIRLYSRAYIRKWVGIDDFLVSVASVSISAILGGVADRSQALFLGITIAIAVGNAKYGWDRHMWDIPFTSYASMYILFPSSPPHSLHSD